MDATWLQVAGFYAAVIIIVLVVPRILWRGPK